MSGLDDLLQRFESIKRGEDGKAVDQALAKVPAPQQAGTVELDDMEQRFTSAYEQGRRDRGEEQGYLETIGKGLVRGAEGIASGVGSIGHWAGEAAGVDPLARGGKWMSEYFDKAAKEGWAAPDPVVFKGSFMDRPSLKRAAGIVSEALPSLAAALFTGGAAAGGLRAAGVAAGAARKAGAAAGAFGLGALEGAPVYEEARKAGKDIGEASLLGGAATIGTGLLEFLPISQMMKPLAKGGIGKLAMKAVEFGGEEAAQEATQQVFQNAIAKYGYDATRDLAEGLAESIIGGFGSGAIAGTTSSRINRWIEDRRKQGVPDDQISNDIDQVGNAIADSMERTADEVSQAPVTDEIATNADAILKQAEVPAVDPEDILMGRKVPIEDIPPALRSFTPGAAVAPATGPITPPSALDDMLSRFTAIQQGEEPPAPAAVPPEAAAGQPIEIPPEATGAPAELQPGLQPAVQGPNDQAPEPPPSVAGPPIEPTGPQGPIPEGPKTEPPATPEDAGQAPESKPEAEAAPVAKEPVKRPAGLDILQEKHIRGRIDQLGSLEAVNKQYSGDTTVEKYARALAEEKYGTAQAAPAAAPAAGIKIEEPAEITLGEGGKPVGGPRTAAGKPEKFTGKPGMAWVNDQQRPIIGAKEINRGRLKGHFIVTLPNGKNKTVPAGSIIRMPEAAPAAEPGQTVSVEGQTVSETPAKEPWQMTLADFKKANPNFSRPEEYHHDQVRFAQQRKLEVPPEVLAGYPDLQPKEAPPAAPQKTPQVDDSTAGLLQRKAQQYGSVAAVTEGGKGIPVGAERIEYRWREAAMYDILDALKQGKTLDEARDIAKEKAKSLILEHNKRRPKDINWQRWEGSTDSTIEDTIAEIKRMQAQPAEGVGIAIETPEAPPAEEVQPHDGWRDNLIKARTYAKGLGVNLEGVDWTDKDSIVAAIDSHLKAKEEAATPKGAADQINEMSMEEIDKVLDDEEKTATAAEQEAAAPAAEEETQPQKPEAPAEQPKPGIELKDIEVNIKALDENGRSYSMKEKADVALSENESQLSLARRILDCLNI
jgi:hypothetical protein